MKKVTQWLASFCICTVAWPVMAQPFSCGGKFLGSDTQAELAQAIVEDGGRAVGVQRVFAICQKGVIQIVLDGNNETSTPSYKKRWQQRAVTLLQVPADKVVVR
ncbi:hypothetical protein PMI27_005479 [Pseudomonas sp. GM41(2012)]|jgi:hypothetical protein|uniref:hypothetical protein n=1 Tax=Pseudomonas sp. (strain GM41(2012)) TaxID=1144708 RepID=UPI0002701912|nr:hypothetical protein [Pseudomonas sp. GM41(2012)]EUB71323.1 hypothetical protein PMI27_005479 [Pseudomonas sp. GM41(2012)]